MMKTSITQSSGDDGKKSSETFTTKLVRFQSTLPDAGKVDLKECIWRVK
jgi:hypothetical protein